MVRSPVDICLGTSPIQAEKSRPLVNAAPLPIAATIALEMIGPMPGTVMTLRQLSSFFANVSISSVTGSIRSSSCRQSLARSATMRPMRGDEARPDPVQRLQIQLFVGLGWNKACRRPLHGLGHRMSISEIIFVPLPKRFRIRGRNLFHIVAQRGKLASDVVRRHPRFDANETGRQVRKPR